jgi:hypothetical protein
LQSETTTLFNGLNKNETGFGALPRLIAEIYPEITFS